MPVAYPIQPITDREAPAKVTRLPGEAIASMAPSSVNGAPEREPAAPSSEPLNNEPLNNQDLLRQLGDDRRWLLQQLDGGQWPELRLDLAALERELGQLLEQASEALKP